VLLSIEAEEPLNTIAIGIPTRRRPSMLQRLLGSILGSDFDQALIDEVHIVVADNDHSQSADPVVKGFQARSTEPFRLHYLSEPKRGLSHVRNAVLGYCLALRPSFIVFVDDDEYVSTNWLHELTKTILRTDADFVLGPVIPDLDPSTPQEVAHWFRFHQFQDQQPINFLDTGNVIMRAAFIEKHGLRFDERFNTTGAEDSFFGITAIKKGASIHWSENAIARETIPMNRANLKWLFLRKLRGSNTYTYIMIIERKFSKVLKKIVVSIFYLFFGIFTLPLAVIPFRFRYIGIIKIAESFGGLSALIGVRYHEYGTKRTIR
jgi:succinoglycan biosynthesis protein ExoM